METRKRKVNLQTGLGLSNGSVANGGLSLSFILDSRRSVHTGQMWVISAAGVCLQVACIIFRCLNIELHNIVVSI